MVDFEEKYGKLSAWIGDTLAHSLAKKLSNREIDWLIAEFKRLCREAREAK